MKPEENKNSPGELESGAELRFRKASMYDAEEIRNLILPEVPGEIRRELVSGTRYLLAETGKNLRGVIEVPPGFRIYHLFAVEARHFGRAQWNRLLGWDRETCPPNDFTLHPSRYALEFYEGPGFESRGARGRNRVPLPFP